MTVSAARPVVLDAPGNAASVEAFLDLLRAALEGEGPPIAPVPASPAPLRQSLVAAVAPDEALDAMDIAVVLATSGSTGDPKGVLLSRAALHASAYAAGHRLGGPARWVLALPTHHIAGLGVLVRSVLAGTEPVVLDLDRPFTPTDFIQATESAVGSRLCTSLVPTQLRRLLDAGAEAHAALRSYDAVLLGGAATPVPLLEQARAAGIAVVTSYGMTETCGGCVYDGVPLDGVTVDTTPDGRLRIGGGVLASGYRLDPPLTASTFTPAGFVSSDLGTVVDGQVSVLGRADDVVVSGGENVALAAVEAVVAGLAGVAEASAYAVGDETWGARVAVMVVAATGADAPSATDVRAAVQARLGRAAAPRDYHVVEALPLLASGKVDRAALARWVT